MTAPIRLILALHNHQPVGNFDGVFEQAYQNSYLPFLDVFESYADLRIALHTSGSLMDWLDQAHPEYVDRLAGLVATGRIEVVGGALMEPILTMIPPRDRVGQIVAYSRWIEDRLGAKVRGIWIPERVWEQSLTSDLVDAGIQYTMLDDFHFKCAGLTEEDLTGYFLTEDNGRLLKIFPGSERLRYTIPFAEPQQTIDYLGGIHERHPGAVIVFADDGEKFGTWPETHAHVYDNGWLRRFFDALAANRDWIKVTTPAEALDAVPSRGKIYLPEGSYREMTEWVLPVARLREYESLRHDMEHDPRWPRLASFIRGGYWRNYKIKYPESDEMYARMLAVSSRLAEAIDEGHRGERIEQARLDLYRGQCNCGYWHGAFGGLYLPHLRHAVYRHLIAADNLLDEVLGRQGARIEATAGDFNLDARQEIRLESDKLSAWIAPAAGGQLYELDVRQIGLNLLATFARRPEAYHDKVRAGGAAGGNGEYVSSIHDRVIFKQEGLDERLQYDDHPRKSLIDHFYSPDTSVDQIVSGHAVELGNFVHGVYEARIRRNPDRIQVQLMRRGAVEGAPITITKGVTLAAGSARLEIAYLIEGAPRDRRFIFSPEMNFAGLPDGMDDRYFYDARRQRLGRLGERLDLRGTDALGLVDEWQGIDIRFDLDRPGGIWAFPIQTVSQSEGGFELVHQSVAVLPHWVVEPDRDGRWAVTMSLTIDTSLAEGRKLQSVEAASI